MIRGREIILWKELLRLGVLSLQNIQLRGGMIQAYKRSWVERGSREQLSRTLSNTRARGSHVKFKWCRVKAYKGTWFFTHRAIKL